MRCCATLQSPFPLAACCHASVDVLCCAGQGGRLLARPRAALKESALCLLALQVCDSQLARRAGCEVRQEGRHALG